MSCIEQIYKGAMLSYVAIGLSLVSALLYTPVLIRVLGTADYGLYALLFTVVSLLTLLDFGVGNATVRYVARNRLEDDEEQQARLIGTVFLFYVAIGCCVVVLGFLGKSLLIEAFLTSFTVKQLLVLEQLLILAVVYVGLSFPLSVFSSVLMAYERFVFLKVSQIVRLIVVPLLSLVGLLLGGRLLMLFSVLMSVQLMISLCTVLYCMFHLRMHLRFQGLEQQFVKGLTVYAFFVFLTTVADRLFWQIDSFLLGILASAEAVAVYAVSLEFVMLFATLSLSLSSLFLPRFSQLVADEANMSEVNRLFLKVSRLQMLLLFFVWSGFLLVGDKFIELWAGADFALVYPLVLILMSTFFIDLVQNTALVVLQARGLFLFRALVLLGCGVLNVVVSIPMIQAFGATGTALVTACFVGVGHVAIMNVYFHRVGLNMVVYWQLFLRNLWPVAVVTMAFYLCRQVLAIDAAGLFVLLMLFVCTYLLVLYLFCMGHGEKAWLWARLRIELPWSARLTKARKE